MEHENDIIGISCCLSKANNVLYKRLEEKEVHNKRSKDQLDDELVEM